MKVTKKRIRRDKWAVYGEYGDLFTNLGDALKCAKRYSLITPDEPVEVWLLDNGCNYFTYLNGKCVRDGWTIKK